MNLIELFLISLSLAVDCFVVSTCVSSVSRIRLFIWISVPLHFGAFQAGMAVLGYLLGKSIYSLISEWSKLLSFALLIGIGTKMLYEAYLSKGTCREINKESQILMLSVATSMDALAIGIALGMTAQGILFSSVFIGMTSLILSLLGLWLGYGVKHIGLKNLGYAAGFVLIALGIKMLIN